MPHRMPFTRRQFVRSAGALAGLSALPAPWGALAPFRPRRQDGRTIRIARVGSNFEREPLIRPYGFKGSAMAEVWQAVAFMESEAGRHGIGLGTQNVLWSDANVFAAHSENGGNAMMYSITERALQMAREVPFETPVDLLDELLEDVYAYGKRITANPDLRKTFALNALVAVDNAAWLLYAAEHGIDRFDDLIPAGYRAPLSHRSPVVASLPSISYLTPIDEVRRIADEGYFFMKIKLGHPGTQEEMLAQDMARIEAVHRAVGHRRTPYTPSGKIPYVFDPNSRYEHIDTLRRLLDHAEQVGMLDQLVLVEEPFPEHYKAEVGGLGVVIAADENAHTDDDVRERIALGYKAIVLKPIAKTLSMTLKILQLTHAAGIPTFCADLTVNPILVDWNKNVAARVAPFPGLGFGFMETNGHQNYRNWETMETYHPRAAAPWRVVEQGVWNLKADFFEESGGMFEPSAHYAALFGVG